MNVNQHQNSPVTCIDISNTLYSQQCIICLQHEPVLDLCNNNYCSCNFTYHTECYRKWREIQQCNKCFLCNNPIVTPTEKKNNTIHNAINTNDNSIISTNTSNTSNTNILSLSTNTNVENNRDILVVERVGIGKGGGCCVVC